MDFQERKSKLLAKINSKHVDTKHELSSNSTNRQESQVTVLSNSHSQFRAQSVKSRDVPSLDSDKFDSRQSKQREFENMKLQCSHSTTSSSLNSVATSNIKKNNSIIDDTVMSLPISRPNATHVVKWVCQECNNECIPVIRESRCLCGHRLKDHPLKVETLQSGKEKVSFKCSSRNCACKNFFYIVAEGAWVLRCRCKHKHIDHDCSKAPYSCKKCNNPSKCAGFDSPWVCNCGCVWGKHKQIIVKSKVSNDEHGSTTSVPLLDLPGASGPKKASETLTRKQFALRQDGY